MFPDAKDPRHVIVKDFRVVAPGRPDIILDVNDKALKDKPYNLKEGKSLDTVNTSVKLEMFSC